MIDTPISELALSGATYGSAITGLRPVVEIMFADFLPLIMDGLINQATKYWYLSNEQGTAPIVVRSACGPAVASERSTRRRRLRGCSASPA